MEAAILNNWIFPPVYATPGHIPWKFKDKIVLEMEIMCIIIKFHFELKSVYKDKLLITVIWNK